MDRRDYLNRTLPWLEAWEESVVEILREAENMEMHHAPVGSAWQLHYERIMTILSHVREAIDATKKRQTDRPQIIQSKVGQLPLADR